VAGREVDDAARACRDDRRVRPRRQHLAAAATWLVGCRFPPGFPRHRCRRRRRATGLNRAGASGLEPATSVVTGQLHDREMNDGGQRIALFVRFRGLGSWRRRLVKRAISAVCSPFAARGDGTFGRIDPSGTARPISAIASGSKGVAGSLEQSAGTLPGDPRVRQFVTSRR
jgi:hypothetical protein